MDDDVVSRFMSLFIGNDRSYGCYSAHDGRMWTIKQAYTTNQVKLHLEGTQGLGMVPILDDGTCRFAVIDIDAHKESEVIDLEELEANVRNIELPLVVCRSKSGGAHLYLFLYEAVSCNIVRPIMAKWASDVGYSGVEIFPKQSRLQMDNTGQMALGNWINLCYFNANDTDRYEVGQGGEKIDFDYFLENAESKRIGNDELQKRFAISHPEAPPCFQQMLVAGIPKNKGVRNRGLYHATVYLKRAFPEDWRDRAHDFNNKVLEEPLPHQEAKKTIASAARRDYGYKCHEEPCASLCDRTTCLTRKFGISIDGPLDANLPAFTDLKKYATDPVKWEISVNEHPMIVPTEALMKFNSLRAVITEHLHLVPPRMKDNQWDAILNRLMQEVQIIEVPDEASTPGMVRYKLEEWLHKTDFDNDGTNTEDRLSLLRGVPIIQLVKGERKIVFRGLDFVAHLKKTRSEELKGVNLWLALKDAGVEHGRMRIGDQIISVWLLGVDNRGNIKLAIPTIKSEF